MQISETLLALRTARGISQEALAEALDVSRQAVSKWETGAALPDVDKIIQLSDFYGVSTDYILKSKGGAAEAEPSPSGAPGGAGAASAEASGGADAGASGAEAGVSRPAADSTAAFAGGMGAEAVFVRVWPVLCLAVSAVTALLFCALWFMGGFWYASTFAHAGVVAVVGTLASAFGTLLFELGALAVPAMKRRRAFFYSYAVWALALLPCCAVSGVIDFVFSNWLWWRLESVLGAVAASVFRAGLVYLLPLILYGGACTSLRDMLSESENA